MWPVMLHFFRGNSVGYHSTSRALSSTVGRVSDAVMAMNRFSLGMWCRLCCSSLTFPVWELWLCQRLSRRRHIQSSLNVLRMYSSDVVGAFEYVVEFNDSYFCLQ